MKKAWKITAVVLAVPAACIALLAADSYHRAIAAIAAHDARLRDDIHALRSKSPAGAIPAGGYEQGQLGQMDLWRRRVPAGPRDSDPAWSGLASMDRTEETTREGGYTAFSYRCYYERLDLIGLRDLLALERVSPGGLQQLAAGLEKRRARRPDLADIVRAEQILDRAEVLNVLHLKRDPTCMIRRAPGWKEFFSWRILVAKCLHQLEEHYREVSGTTAALPQGEELTRSALRTGVSRLDSTDRQTRAQWKLTQMAAALELFLEEKGRVPKDLKEVFPEPPVSPYDGAPYQYKEEKLTDVGAKISWTLRPR